MRDHAVEALNHSPWLHMHSVNSTNNLLLTRPSDELVNGMTCTADIQTEGLGRRNRTWTSPLGGLYMSIVLLPKVDQKFWHLVSFVMGVAAVKSIEILYPDLNPRLKWPNDILVNQFKVAGILVQSKSHPSPRLVVGIGVNVSTDLRLLPERTLFPAGTLDQMSCFSIPIHKLAHAIRSNFFYGFVKWSENPCDILSQWESLSATRNAWVTIKSDEEKFTGQYSGLSNDGGLQLLVDNRTMVFYSGDILAIVGEKS